MKSLLSIALTACIACAPAGLAAQEAPTTYTAEEVAFDVPDSDNVRLSGVVTMPDGEGPFPAVVLVSGAGPHDRDSSNAGHKPFAVLADYLSGHGIAVLRYDDRGVGGSTGDLATASWLDLAADAEAGAHFLSALPRIDGSEIGITGHSQGGIVAPIAAERCGCFAFLISLAGPSSDFIEFTLRQRRQVAIAQGAPEEVVLRTEPVLAEVFAAIAAAESLEDARNAARAVLSDEALATLGAPITVRERLIDQLASEGLFIALHNEPQRVLPKIEIPVLALTGTLDAVLNADENLGAIEAALQGNPDVTTVKLERINHFFQTAKTGDPSEYAELAEDFAPIALEIIADWISARFGGV